ncbi:MAG: TPM domain-containing protein, partial [Pyrinomonadaceae bacterium]
MNFSNQTSRALALLTILTILIVSPFPARAFQSQDRKPQFPARTAQVNDFAAVLDASTKQRTENTLQNVRDRTGIEFVVAIIKTAADQDVFDYSLQLADDWDVGSKTSKQKSLLLVIAADTGKFFTQASKNVKGDLPDGLIGEMGRRMRLQFEAREYNDGLTSGIRAFVNEMAEQKGLNLAGIEQPPAGIAPSTPAETPKPVVKDAAQPVVNDTPQTVANETPKPIARDTPNPAVNDIPKPVVNETPKPSESPTPLPVDSPAQLISRPRVVATPTPPQPEITSPATTASPELPTATPEVPTTKPEVPTATPEVVGAKVAPPSDSGGAPSIAEVARPPAPVKKSEAGADDAETVELTLTLPPEQRLDALKSFMDTHPRSTARPRAAELIVVARAALGDQKLQAGDVAGGLEQFRLAVAESPAEMSDKLYSDVVSRFPLNLMIRGQRTAALESARSIEALVRVNPKRLLALASFYLAIEDVGEATRLAEFAVKLAPELPAAHQALGSARHIGLRLDEAAVEYARALELDPKSAPARRSLADLKRAAGNPQEALALYREQLQADPKDSAARTGLILSLFDLGKKDEAEAELASALKEDEQNVPLLTGAAYWLTAHNEVTRGLELAQKAVQIEPRYTWAQIAMARALVANKRPLEAERALRFVRQYGRFPTLDYELASVLGSMGLYEEAAAELARSFTLRNGEIETKLAGRLIARAATFTELLAPERRASIFQATSVDTESNAKILKSLLNFAGAIDGASVAGGNQAVVVAAGQEFAAGEDPMRTYRQIFVASRLLKKGIALPTVIELSDAAMQGVEAALDTPAATVAVQADDLLDIRASAIAAGGTPPVPDAPRTALSALLRGRIEDLTGWTLFNQEKIEDAVKHLRLAVGVLPEQTPLWRAALWHLGAALEADGKPQQALLYYMKSYVTGLPDPIRRPIIESLYRKVNGSLEGLDEKIGPS